MNIPVIKKWVEMLRSGEYKQGNGFLKRKISLEEPTYCCLGVLSELAVKEGVIPEPEEINESFFYGRKIGTNGSRYYLCEEVMKWSGVDSHGGYDPLPGNGGFTKFLTSDNDRGKNFNEIADIIENNYLATEKNSA